MTSEWSQTTLGSIAINEGYGLVDGPFGSNLPASLYTNEGVPVIRGSNLALGTSRFRAQEFVFVSWDTAKRLSRSLCRPLDVIFTKKGTLGQTGLVPEGTKYDQYLLSSNQMKLTVDPLVADPLFVYYSVSSPESIEKIVRDSEATGVPKTNVTYLREFPIRLPPLSEQRAIAHILGTLDDKIELNRRMNETLEAMARALFKDWFVDFGPTRAKIEGRDPYLAPETWDLFPDQLADSELGPIPEGWDVCELGDLCHKAQYGYTASATSQPVGPKFLRITDINKQSWIDWSRVPYCEATNKEASKYRLHSGDLLIARMADPGHGVLVEEDVETVFASYLIRFRPIKEPHARLLQYWLKSTEYWQLVESRAAGTTRVSLNAKVLSEFPLVIPANPVADAFASQTGALRDRLVESASEIQKLAALRDLLLPKLMSGEVRIPDADKFVQESP